MVQKLLGDLEFWTQYLERPRVKKKIFALPYWKSAVSSYSAGPYKQPANWTVSASAKGVINGGRVTGDAKAVRGAS